MRARPSAAAALLAGAIVAVSLLVPYRTLAATAGSEWWRLLTSQFVHVYLLHALFNALAVLVIGSQLERRVGAAWFVAAWFVCGTIGQLVAVDLLPTIPATGASQAALGVAAMTLVLAIRARTPRLLIAPLLYIAVQLALDLFFAQRIKLPHAASLAAGALAACTHALRRAPLAIRD